MGPQHHIRRIRTELGISQAELARRIGRDKSLISRLESGDMKLDLQLAKQVADAMEVTVAEVIGIDKAPRSPARGFSEDVQVYEPPAGDQLASLKSAHRYLHKVATDVLDRTGIAAGDILMVDGSSKAVEALKAGAIVLVRYHAPNQFHAPKTLLRQFLPPSLLVTNSSKGNLASLDTMIDDAHIIGVVVSSHRLVASG